MLKPGMVQGCLGSKPLLWVALQHLEDEVLGRGVHISVPGVQREHHRAVQNAIPDGAPSQVSQLVQVQIPKGKAV